MPKKYIGEKSRNLKEIIHENKRGVDIQYKLNVLL